MDTVTDDDILLRTDKDGIATLTLNRPDARNALSTGLMAALHVGENQTGVAHEGVGPGGDHAEFAFGVSLGIVGDQLRAPGDRVVVGARQDLYTCDEKASKIKHDKDHDALFAACAPVGS